MPLRHFIRVRWFSKYRATRLWRRRTILVAQVVPFIEHRDGWVELDDRFRKVFAPVRKRRKKRNPFPHRRDRQIAIGAKVLTGRFAPPTPLAANSD
jgi:hypothetical protein